MKDGAVDGGRGEQHLADRGADRAAAPLVAPPPGKGSSRATWRSASSARTSEKPLEWSLVRGDPDERVAGLHA